MSEGVLRFSDFIISFVGDWGNKLKKHKNPPKKKKENKNSSKPVRKNMNQKERSDKVSIYWSYEVDHHSHKLLSSSSSLSTKREKRRENRVNDTQLSRSGFWEEGKERRLSCRGDHIWFYRGGTQNPRGLTTCGSFYSQAILYYLLSPAHQSPPRFCLNTKAQSLVMFLTKYT